ncbi:MAG: HAMP domain-containing histidine kinase [Clostridiales bacterium]|nr:HAMP domain-containing histidine kinase [Clostridiales bacterium]
MNIQTYRRKFILIAMTAMTACLVLLLTMINLFNCFSVVAEQKDILSILLENGGRFPTFGSPMSKRRPGHSYEITEESEHRVRFFVVTVSPEGDIIHVNLQQIAAVDDQQAAALGQKAAASGQEYGFAGNYIYKVSTREGSPNTHIIFLDWQEKLTAVKSFAFISVISGTAGLAMTFLIVLWLSQRAIRPVIVSSQKQQQFITDASHELKTPLSAISVNMELLGMELGENEWIASTNDQLSMLRRLVDQLICTARMDEEASLYGKKQELDFSELVTDAVTCFMPMAETTGRTIEVNAPEGITMLGNEELLRRMLSVLCDNAIKHARGEGNIVLSLSAKPKAITLRIQNPWPHAKDTAIYERMFYRFYKADPARSKDSIRNGFGVGLSIASKAAQWHGGAIKASPVDKDQICFAVTLRRK